ncbi:MAG TPA: NF041680 family putative transposase [Dermatophilaceae bacterium]|nr:NF041680 family putative transposase [Dermatophilaceae bacterium]
MTKAVAVSSVIPACPAVDATGVLARFRREFYASLYAREDALFELTDALLCAEGPVKALVELSLAAEHRRSHGGMYAALSLGDLEPERLRRALVSVPLPTSRDGRITLAVDVSNWLRPDAATSPHRLFCHTYGRGRSKDQFIPGWPYSFVAALESGPTSWTALPGAVRLAPADDASEVTATQLRAVIARLIHAGHWAEGDPRIMVVADAGYDVARLAYLLADLPVLMVARVRSDRVYRFGAKLDPRGKPGRPTRHGPRFSLADPDPWPVPDAASSALTPRYGRADIRAWRGLHPMLTHRSGWIGHDGELPIVPATVIRLQVEHLPGDRDPDPVWLWCSDPGADPDLVTACWTMFLRRFDLEHTFRFLKQTLGWTRPKLRSPQAADRWTWLVIAAHAQLRLARPLAADLRRPWERPLPTGKLTPARVRRGFRNIRADLPHLARAPKTHTPGPGRPVGSKNKAKAPVHAVGKTEKRALTLEEHYAALS